MATIMPVPQYLDLVEVDSTTDSTINLSWTIKEDSTTQITGFQVHFQKVASSYIQYSAMLSSMTTSYKIRNLVADTFYKVCVVMYRNDTSQTRQKCADATTASWHLPVSVGSSIGAMLALSLIVLMVLIARCPSVMRRRKGTVDSGKYDSMTSNLQDDRLEMSDTILHVQDDPLSDQDSITVEVPASFREQIMKHRCQGMSEGYCNGNQGFCLSTTPSQDGYIPQPGYMPPTGYSTQACYLPQTGYVQAVAHARPHLHRQVSSGKYEGCPEENPHCSHMHSTIVKIEHQPLAPKIDDKASLDQNNPL